MNITTPYGQIEYSDIGNGYPLIFIHGGHSNCNETLFHKGYDTDKYRLITPSRPGYGNTPLGNNLTPRDAAELIIKLLEKLNLEEFIVIGISAGGLTSIEIAANYPSKVKKLILISAVTTKWLSPTDPNYRKGKKLFSPVTEKYIWWLYRTFFKIAPKAATSVLLKELSVRKNVLITDDEIDELYSKMISKQRSYNGFVNDLDQHIAPDLLSNISCPTLILHSINDRSVSLKHAEHAFEKISNGKLITYDNDWGHLLWLGQDSVLPIKDVNSFIVL